jgi:hypothetical protein
MQTTSTIWRDNRPHYVSVPNIGKRTVYKATLETECGLNYVHFSLRKETGVKSEKEHPYEHVSKPADTSHKIR